MRKIFLLLILILVLAFPGFTYPGIFDKVLDKAVDKAFEYKEKKDERKAVEAKATSHGIDLYLPGVSSPKKKSVGRLKSEIKEKEALEAEARRLDIDSSERKSISQLRSEIKQKREALRQEEERRKKIAEEEHRRKAEGQKQQVARKSRKNEVGEMLGADSKARKIFNIVKQVDGYTPPLLSQEVDPYIMYKARIRHKGRGHSSDDYFWLYSHEVTRKDKRVPFPVGKHLSVSVDMEGEFVKRLVGKYMATLEFFDLKSDGKFDKLMVDNFLIYERKKINKKAVQELDAIYSKRVSWVYVHRNRIERQ